MPLSLEFWSNPQDLLLFWRRRCCAEPSRKVFLLFLLTKTWGEKKEEKKRKEKCLPHPRANALFGFHSAPLSGIVSKASSGALEVLKVYNTHNLGIFLQDSANANWEIVGTATSRPSSIPSTELHLTKPTIVVLGNEGEGLRPVVLKRCTKTVTIPSAWSTLDKNSVIVESLNVSVATGVILHQLLGTGKQS